MTPCTSLTAPPFANAALAAVAVPEAGALAAVGVSALPYTYVDRYTDKTTVV